jgi:hypothetical protein
LLSLKIAGSKKESNGFSVQQQTLFSAAHKLDASDAMLSSVPFLKKEEDKHHYIRKYKWIDPQKVARETLFSISKLALQDEVKKFGRSPAITHPTHVRRRGFKIIGRQSYIKNNKVYERYLTIVDYKQIFERNLKYFYSLTNYLIKSSELLPGADPLFTFLRFVQYIPYKQPPEIYRGKYIGRFFIPLVCLYEQYGDCDSKSLLLSEFLISAPDSQEKAGMIVIQGKGLSHALLGAKRKPLLGMTALHLRGKGYYIILETTSPGWAPGFVSSRVLDVIKGGYFQFIELN